MTLTVNGHDAEPGCYVEGHWGQYGPDHLADQLEGFGIVIARSDNPNWWRKVADRMDEIADKLGESHDPSDMPKARNRAWTAWENHSECGDDLIEKANDVTEGGYWEWWEGEVFLRSYVCPECGRDATDPHWEFEMDGINPPSSHKRPPCDYCCDADDPGVFA